MTDIKVGSQGRFRAVPRYVETWNPRPADYESLTIVDFAYVPGRGSMVVLLAGTNRFAVKSAEFHRLWEPRA